MIRVKKLSCAAIGAIIIILSSVFLLTDRHYVYIGVTLIMVAVTGTLLGVTNWYNFKQDTKTQEVAA